MKTAVPAVKPSKRAICQENPAGRLPNDLLLMAKYPCRFGEYRGRRASPACRRGKYLGRFGNEQFRPLSGTFPFGNDRCRLTDDVGSP